MWSTAAAIIAYRSLISLEVGKDTAAEVGSSHHEAGDLQRSGSFDRGGGMSCDSTC